MQLKQPKSCRPAQRPRRATHDDGEKRHYLRQVHLTRDALSGTQWHSVALSGTQWHSVALSGTQLHSVALSGTQWHSEAIRGNQ